jgi:aminoglycoside 3-N-acetyltransferase I
LNISRLGPADSALGVEAIRLLKAPDGYPVPPVEYMSRLLSRPQNVLLVATEGSAPVGYLVAYLLDRIDRDQKMMFFYEIGVEKSHRRRGFGKKLIAHLKEICREADLMKMWVPTNRSNVAATRLYESTGGVAFSVDDEVTYGYSRESFMATPERW